MFISEKIVFMELQKTGCTHIRNLLKEIVGGEFVERHIQADPRLFTRERSFLGSVRDPWDWHVSLWAYGCDGRGDFHKNVTTPGIRIRDRGWRLHPYSTLREWLACRPNRHAQQWRRTFRDAGDAGAFREWLYMLHDDAYLADVGEGYWRSAMSRFAGLLTYRYMKIFACRKGELDTLQSVSTPEQLVRHERQHCFIDHFIRNERLEPDLLAVLERLGVEVPARIAASMAARPRTNTSSKRHGADYYYDADTARLVGERDRLIVDKFGYAPPALQSSAGSERFSPARVGAAEPRSARMH